MADSDYMYKICIFGNGGVGKTSLTQRYLRGLFNEGIELTIGSNFYVKKLYVNKSVVTLQIWDFGGEQQFRYLFPQYFRGTSGAIFMYDLTRYFTITRVKEWMDLIKDNFSNCGAIPIVLVGGKSDLIDNRKVTKENVENVMKEYGFINHFECSSKTGYNVEEIFVTLTLCMMKNNYLIH